VKDLNEFNILQVLLHGTLDRLSNNEPVDIKDDWIEAAGEQFKAALRKQLTTQDREFGLRMSNIGRPLCQLQKEQEQAPKSRNPYNHILRMIIGDATEIAVNLILRASEVNITNEKEKVEFLFNGQLIKGENDTEIDHKVYDIKSSSPYAFTHKWKQGWDGVYHGDTFGYVAQLYGYAGRDPARMGGWIVVDKSSGEIIVVEARPTADQLKVIGEQVDSTVRAIRDREPFRRSFEAEDELFYKTPTGNKTVPMPCTFCNYMAGCWPEAVLKPKAMSKAKDPKVVWYAEYTPEVVDGS
jgi:hypothetical protein